MRFQRNGSRPRQRNGRKKNPAGFSIIVHSHLCWDWVWQRPQQFLSRLSARHKVLFVETVGPDPQLAVPTARFRTLEDFPDITVLRVQFPEWRWPDAEFVDRGRRELVRSFLAGPAGGDFQAPVQWFYDPMAAPAFLGQLSETLTVYDCMDELSRFRCAPPEIAAREAELLAHADVVFTGGRKLYELKRRLNPNCHFYGCGVDVAHFGKARHARTAVPDDLASFKKPVLGYFGVVDERMDYDLIGHLADANPDWSIVMVGPTLKVDGASLPRHANIHWLGQRSYEQLPAYCKGFDVCLMPFALNEATEYINPTKALEYMAAGRLIVSSAVPDVVRNFGSVVQIARTPEDFVSLCRQAVTSPDSDAVQRGLQMAADHSWDSIVAKLERHIQTALRKKQKSPTFA